MTDLSIAIVHEWVDARAGSEQVFEAIAQEFPAADLYALTYRPGVRMDVGGRAVQTTALNRRRLRDHRSVTLPFMPLAWWALGTRGYDLVVSSSHAFAHANRLARPDGVHLSYVHSPARYLWSPEIDERGDSALLAPAKALLRHVDLAASRRVSGYAANSSTVASRIRDCWGRNSRVIYPPVRVEFFGAHRERPARDYLLGVGRWIGYKNLALVIEVGEMTGLPVKLAGRGPEQERLRSLAANASVEVEIIESPSDEELRRLYANALCLVFPTVEDFGMVPVEAQAAGTPVVAVAQGGALDTVAHGVSGVLVDTLAIPALASGIELARQLDTKCCVDNAAKFSRRHFGTSIRAWTEDYLVRIP